MNHLYNASPRTGLERPICPQHYPWQRWQINHNYPSVMMRRHWGKGERCDERIDHGHNPSNEQYNLQPHPIHVFYDPLSHKKLRVIVPNSLHLMLLLLVRVPNSILLHVGIFLDYGCFSALRGM